MPRRGGAVRCGGGGSGSGKRRARVEASENHMVPRVRRDPKIPFSRARPTAVVARPGSDGRVQRLQGGEETYCNIPFSCRACTGPLPRGGRDSSSLRPLPGEPSSFGGRAVAVHACVRACGAVRWNGGVMCFAGVSRSVVESRSGSESEKGFEVINYE